MNRLELAARGKDDLYFLAKEVLGYSKMIPDPHQDLCRFYERSKKRTKLVLMPRGSYKSSVVTVAASIQGMIENPDIRILISSETQNKAIKFVGEVKQHIEMNLKFRTLYGDWVNTGNTWKGNEFIIAPRKHPKKEPTIMAGSLEKGTQVGMHYDLIILDDVVSRNNVATLEQIEKTIDHYKLLLSILEPDGKIVVVGTRWAHYELHGWLLDPDGPEFGQVDSFVRQAVDADGNPTMPKVLPKEFLEQQRLTQGEYIFACQYQNNITSGDNNSFDIADVQFYDKSPPGLIYFMTVDPAVSLKARSDFSGIIVNGVDHKGDWYIQEALKEKLEPSDLIRTLFMLARKYPLMCMGMEKFALEKMLRVNLDNEMMAQDFFWPIKDLQTSTRISKEARIRGLQPNFQAKKIYIKPEHKELYKEITEHPFGRHDDLLDALKSQLDIVFPSDYIPAQAPNGPQLSNTELRIWEDLRKFTRRKVKQTSDY